MNRYLNYKNYLRRISLYLIKAGLFLNPEKQSKEKIQSIYKITNYQKIDNNLAVDNRERTPHGEQTTTNETLNDIIDIEKFKGKRILEIGPKWGHASLWIDKVLSPSCLVMIELPNFKNNAKLNGNKFDQKDWLSQLKSPYKIIYENILISEKLIKEEPFDLIICTGVLYHNIEQVKLLNILRRLTNTNGAMILQTTIYSMFDEPFVYYAWFPESMAGVVFPTKLALLKMLGMTGWTNVKHYIRFKPKSNTVLMTCEKNDTLPGKTKDSLEIGGSKI